MQNPEMFQSLKPLANQELKSQLDQIVADLANIKAKQDEIATDIKAIKEKP